MNYRKYIEQIINGDAGVFSSVLDELKDNGVSSSEAIHWLLKACVSIEEMEKLRKASLEMLADVSALHALIKDDCFALAISVIYRYHGDRTYTDKVIFAYVETGHVGYFPTSWRMLMELHRLKAASVTIDVNEYRDVVLKYATVDTVKELTEHRTLDVSTLPIDPLSFITNTTKH